jgi:hypothetical protein
VKPHFHTESIKVGQVSIKNDDDSRCWPYAEIIEYSTNPTAHSILCRMRNQWSLVSENSAVNGVRNGTKAKEQENIVIHTSTHEQENRCRQINGQTLSKHPVAHLCAGGRLGTNTKALFTASISSKPWNSKGRARCVER